MLMYVCLCKCVCTYIYTCLSTYIHVYINTYTDICINMQAHICLHIHTCLHIYKPSIYTYPYILLHLLQYWKSLLIFYMNIVYMQLWVGLNLKQRQRQDKDDFKCKLHLLTLSLFNTPDHNFEDKTVEKN